MGELKQPGLIFWPVRNGDSTTIVIRDGLVLQVDLNHLETAEDEELPAIPVIDRLVEQLPTGSNRRPYLACFALTHPDQDHCRGFARLLSEVDIGELWFTPRVFEEYAQDLSDDAKAFRKEAMRRVRVTIESGGAAESGDRVRIIGFRDRLTTDQFEGFPEDRLTVPGEAISDIDGQELADCFRAFVHAPFEEDGAAERNKTSAAFQIALRGEDGSVGSALLLGDLDYPVLRRIFDLSQAQDVAFDVLLAPHHCSKSAMYWRDDNGDEELKTDILNDLAAAANESACTVASSRPIPPSNTEGDDPPHAKAKMAYEETIDEFLCTHEHAGEKDPQPIVFEVTSRGLEYQKVPRSSEPETTATSKHARLAAAVYAARGDQVTPKSPVGFG